MSAATPPVRDMTTLIEQVVIALQNANRAQLSLSTEGDEHALYYVNRVQDRLKQVLYDYTPVTKAAAPSIEVVRRGEQYHCQLADDPTKWEAGATPEEALGRWFITRSADYGIRINMELAHGQHNQA